MVDVVGSMMWLALMLVGIFILALYVYQRWLVYVPYFPNDARSTFELPVTYGLNPEQVQDAVIRTLDGETLQAYFILHNKSMYDHAALPTVLYLHENAGNLSHRFGNIKAMLERVECNCLILSYRGYGSSTGVPSETALLLDSMAALRFLHSRKQFVDKENIILFGRSLGGAAALLLASELNQTQSEFKIKCMIIENSFESIPILLTHIMPLFASMSSLVTNSWNRSFSFFFLLLLLILLLLLLMVFVLCLIFSFIALSVSKKLITSCRHSSSQAEPMSSFHLS